MLVHELLEIYFAPFKSKEKTKEHEAQEVALNMIAEALVKLDRERNGG